ncbi:MAG: hypothetical protein LBG14_02440 [Treponema sp.]|nr:hypothetical protein [Treponema sp.]
MFSKELTSLIISVLTSWQVIAVTLGIAVYIAIVSNAARLYHSARPKQPRVKRPGREKKGKETEENAETDELGLEE